MRPRSDSSLSSRRPPSGSYGMHSMHGESSLSDQQESTGDSHEEKKDKAWTQILEYGCMVVCCTTAAALALWILYLGRRGGQARGQRRSAELSHSVVTSSGSLRGLWVDAGNSSVLAFYGIPYAEPPLGVARFQRPTPIRPWQGELRAIFKAPPCPPQWLRVHERQRGRASADWTEDCLHVNLWTPSLSPAKLRPVVVLLHGGHFTHGSNRLRQYDGALMAARCDCVVAVPNYRLGVFGFLYANVTGFPGNQGLWDQHLALHWIKGNAAAFGGDPRSLVLWGVDAGAISAGLHILSPLGGSALFSRAVLQGGSPLSCLGECADAENVRLVVAKLCTSPDEAEDERRALACLQAAYTAALVALPVDDYFAQTLSPFLPTYGDPLVPVDPKVLASERRPVLAPRRSLQAAAAPRLPAPLSVLVGFGRGEGTHFFARFLDASTNGSWAHFTPDQHRGTASALFTFTLGEEILEVENLHTDLESLNDAGRVFRHYGALLDEALYVCPALAFAEYLSDSALVHVYEFGLVDHEAVTPAQAPQHNDDFDAAFHFGAEDYLEPPGARGFSDAVLDFIDSG
ncbi:acetylcholinesterase-like [Amblyomma americanum]